MKWKAPAFLVALLVAFPAHSEPTDPLAYYGRVIGEVHVEGVPWAHDVEQKIRGAVRPHQRLWLPGVQRAIVDVLFNNPTPGQHPSRITVVAEPAAGNTINVRFVLEPTRRIAGVDIQGNTSLERIALLRAANLPLGGVFWPDDVDAAARRIAALYFEAGWRDARVGWEARPVPDSNEVQIAFAIAEGVATTLVQLEFSGDKGLTDGELYAAFDIDRGDRLSLESIDAGIANLLARYREKHYYLARVNAHVDAADGRAVVELKLHAGPRFHLQVRGNRTFPESLLLSRLRYTGDDPLDAGVEGDLANRMAAFYHSVGFPDATVFVCENVPGVVGCVNSQQPPDSPDSSSGDRLVTFLVTEGSPVRVVERRFEGLHYADRDFTPEKLLERIDAALSDSVPAEVKNAVDDSQRSAVDRSQPDMKPRHRYHVVASEVLSESAYEDAAKEITKLYQSRGFLNARVYPPRVEPISPGLVRVAIPIEEGPQIRVRSVSLVKWKVFNPRQPSIDDESDYLPDEEVMAAVQKSLSEKGLPPVEAGQPVSSISLEEARNTIVQFYKEHAHLFVRADYREVLNDAGDAEDVVFGVRAGKEVRVASIEIKGATHTSLQLIRDALDLEEDKSTDHPPCGDGEKMLPSCITPKRLDKSVENLLKTQIFTSAAVDIADPDREDMPYQRLIVQVREKPTVALEVTAGLSLADGPRAGMNVRFANLGGRNKSIGFTAKVNYPVFRYNGLFVAQNCGIACNPKSDPIERYLALTFGLPIYLLGGKFIDQHYDLVNENKVRPAYHLEGSSAVATFNNLLNRKIETGGRVIKVLEISASLQSDVEYDILTPDRGITTPLALPDQKALLMPAGPVSLVSVRPSLKFDARDSSVNPMAGFVMSLGLDVSKSLALIETKNPVQLLRGQLSMTGYIPVYRPRRISLALSASAGGIQHAGPAAQVISTKRFFLGGTGSMRGFNEDDLVPEDQRATIHNAIVRCHSLVSQGTCGTSEYGTALDPSLLAVANGTGVSTGGDYMILARAELKFGLLSWMDGAVFVDAGNLWVEASNVNPLDLRTSVGGAISVPLPIGPAEFGVGVNLHPDLLLQEPPYRIFLSIGAF